MAIIHRIGVPENDSETKAIKRLGKKLPDDYYVFHNFELTTGRGLPYEYDIAVLSPHALYHLEVKGYHGAIRGNSMQWVFENGSVYPSPIPLANKKTKVLAGKLRQFSRRLDDVFVETLILLTDDHASIKLNDDQANRVVHLNDVIERLCEPKWLPVSTTNITGLHETVCEALFATRPSQKTRQIGLYDVIEKLDQDDRFTVFLAKHRFIQTQPLSYLKVYHFDVYVTPEEKVYRLREVFHGQDATRLLGGHPNLLHAGDIFAWNDDTFVEPTEYVEKGRRVETLLGDNPEWPLTWPEKIQIIKGVGSGLAHAHRHGVIHRDVRPSNIVVAPGGLVKLANFDLAFIPNAPNVNINASVREHFDPRYVAPAVWENPSDVVPASDVYSLGLVFYQLITGQPPKHDVEAVLAGKGLAIDKKLLVEALGRSGLRGDLAGVAEIIARMCAPERAERYATVAEVMEDLAVCEL
jgi:Protein kinase domain/Nuclease-related domain